MKSLCGERVGGVRRWKQACCSQDSRINLSQRAPLVGFRTPRVVWDRSGLIDGYRAG